MIAAVAACVSVAVIAITAAIYWRQLLTMNKSWQLQSTLAMLRYLDDEELLRLRWFFYEHHDKLQDLLHPDLSTTFSWEVRDRWNATLRQLSDGSVDFHKLGALIHALDNIAFLVNEGYVPYDPIVSNIMENTFRAGASLFGDYIRYRQHVETQILPNAKTADYVPSYGRNLLLLANRIVSSSRGSHSRLLVSAFHAVRSSVRQIDERLDAMNGEPSLSDRVLAVENTVKDLQKSLSVQSTQSQSSPSHSRKP